MRSSRWVAASALLAVSLLASRPAFAADALWVAKTQTIAAQLTAYADVEPQAVLPVRAGVAGVLRDLTVQPGDDIAAGAILGHLAGPSADALLTARQSALASAEAALKVAQQELAIEREKKAAQLTTRSAVDRAAAAVSAAVAHRDGARAELNAAEEMASV